MAHTQNERQLIGHIDCRLGVKRRLLVADAVFVPVEVFAAAPQTSHLLTWASTLHGNRRLLETCKKSKQLQEARAT